MAQLTIKYRRRVTEDKVKQLALILREKSYRVIEKCEDDSEWGEYLPLKKAEQYVRIILEANAEVIEAQPYDKIKGYMLLDYGGSVCDLEEIEQFHAEWEEIE